MDDALKILLLATLMLLVCAHAANYESLTVDLRYYVDKSMEKTRNYYPAQHVAYVSMKTEVMGATLNANVLLKVSNCKKAPRNADKCVPQNHILYLIDCLVCKTTEDEELVDCGKWKEVKMNKREQRHTCKFRPSTNHLTGGSVLLHKAKDSQIGCLGCV